MLEVSIRASSKIFFPQFAIGVDTWIGVADDDAHSDGRFGRQRPQGAVIRAAADRNRINENDGEFVVILFAFICHPNLHEVAGVSIPEIQGVLLEIPQSAAEHLNPRKLFGE